MTDYVDTLICTDDSEELVEEAMDNVLHARLEGDAR
jgi:hypothetical protein